MKTFKEIVEEFANIKAVSQYEWENIYEAFFKGIRIQKEKLLKWHSPEEQPINNSEVLTKFIRDKNKVIYDASTYKSGHFNTCFPYFDIDGYEFIGWRYIKEL